MDYLVYLQTIWHYFPYFFYTFVFVTFLPKSFGNIRRFSQQYQKDNHIKYHRCYAPDLCCHMLVDDEEPTTPKPKPRKAVTRVYPKKTFSSENPVGSEDTVPHGSVVKRQVQVSAIQTQTNVNQIAKMFESGAATKQSKKVIRVPPRIIPEICTRAADDEINADSVNSKGQRSQLSQLLQENIENSANLLNQQQISNSTHASDANWRSEPIVPMRSPRARTKPSALTFAGTSATPSTASPAASSPMSTSPTISASPVSSPVRRSAPLNMKSSLEDIFAAIARNAEKNENFIFAGSCNTLSPVTSIDDILAQRRLSRPLSAYSISDLLNDDNNAAMDEAYVESFLRTLNKT